MDYKIILRKGNYALLEAKNDYIVACGFDENKPNNQQWGHGYYYTFWNANENDKHTAFYKAIETYRMKTEENYISRYRLEELATKLAHNFIQCDEKYAKQVFEEECELLESEMEWFGITESEEE